MTGIDFLRRLRRDRRGVSAVEFALIAPVMMLMYFGMTELSQSMMAQRKADHIASSIGDLVAQSKSIDDTTMGDLFKIGNTIASSRVIDPRSSGGIRRPAAGLLLPAGARWRVRRAIS